jgi:hypothetical protein
MANVGPSRVAWNSSWKKVNTKKNGALSTRCGYELLRPSWQGYKSPEGHSRKTFVE